MSAGLIRKSRKWVSATTMMRREGSGIERQAAGMVGCQVPFVVASCSDAEATSWLTSSASLRPRASRRPRLRRIRRSARALWSARPRARCPASRRAGQPEAHEHGQRLIRDGDVPFDPLHLPRHAIETSRQRRLQPVGAVGRQMRGERRLDDQRLRHALASGIVSELAGEIRRKTKGVLGAHGRHICMSSPGSSETWRATVPKVRCMMRWR